MRLDGKIALITGGGSGIGAAIAERFVAEGARVCIAGRRLTVLEAMAGSLPLGAAVVCQGDVAEDEDAARMVATTVEFGGRLDILVNNAAIATTGSVADADRAEWRRSFDVNVAGPFVLMQEAIPHMIEGGGGSIINIASVGGVRCFPGLSAYGTTKAALIMLTQQAALDFGVHNIRCNVVCSGVVRTPMLEMEVAEAIEGLGCDMGEYLAGVSRSVPLRRCAEPREIAAACAFLASEDASFVTGAALMVDGGEAIVDANSASISESVDWKRRSPTGHPDSASDPRASA